MMCSGQGGERERGRQGRVERTSSTQIYLEAGSNVLPNRSTFPLRLGGGVGVGQDGGCDAPCTCAWSHQQELLLQPAPCKGVVVVVVRIKTNQHPSPTNHRFLLILSQTDQVFFFLLARDVQPVHT